MAYIIRQNTDNMFVKFAFQERNYLSFCCRLKNKNNKDKTRNTSEFHF